MSGPLHILLADPHLRGGGQVRYVASLARELTARGLRVTVACRPNSVLIEAAQQAGAAALPVFAFRGGLRPAAWGGDLKRAKEFLRVERPDIVHVNGSQDHWTFAMANRLAGKKACLVRTRHNTYKVKSHGMNRRLNRKWTDYQIVVCDDVRKQLARESTFDARRLCTIHNGVDPEAFKHDEEIRERARAEFGYDDEHIVCGIAARLVPAKGHQFLFKAIGQLVRYYPQIRVLALGQGDLQKSLQDMVGALKLQAHVKFAGFREDIAYCTQAFDIGVLPSVDCDTSSFSLKEEMAMEKPVVASDYGGLKEIITNGVEGIVVPTGTVEPIATGLKRLIDQPELRRSMGRAGRRRVMHEFTLEVFADRTLAAYHRALQYHRDPASLDR